MYHGIEMIIETPENITKPELLRILQDILVHHKEMTIIRGCINNYISDCPNWNPDKKIDQNLGLVF